MDSNSFSGRDSKTAELAARIEADIRAGTLAPGTRLASQRELCAHWGVTSRVVFNALGKLEAKGLVVRSPRSGVVVSPAFRSPESRLIGVLTSYRRGDVEDYYEPLMAMATARRVTPMINILVGDNWQQTVRDMMAKSPDAVLVDIEAHNFPLAELRQLLAPAPVCHVNRWEWVPEQPGLAVLTDFPAAMSAGLKKLLSRGHERILQVVAHHPPHAHVAKTLATARLAAGFAPDDRRLRQVSIVETRELPDAVRQLVANFKPTAIQGWSDHFLALFEQLCPDTVALDRLGFFDTSHSRRPRHEFSSFKIDFADIWGRALDSFRDPAATIKVMPTLIERWRGRGCRRLEPTQPAPPGSIK